MATSPLEHGADLPQLGPGLRITIVTTYHLEDGPPQLRFHPRFFKRLDSDTLFNILGAELHSSISMGLCMIIVEDWYEWAVAPFMAAIPSLPVKLLGEVNSGLGLSMLPIFEDGDQTKEFCYVTDHIDIRQRPANGYSRGSFRLGDWEARRQPIATWVRQVGAFPQDPNRSAIVIFGGKSVGSLSERLEKHYTSEGSRRWDRLCGCLSWIYLDLFYVFTNWDSTLEVARFNVEAKEQVRIHNHNVKLTYSNLQAEDMFNRIVIAPIVQQTRELHRDASTTLALQEGLRLHQASVKRFQRSLQSAPDSTEVAALRVRMEYVSESLEFYETTCLTILEQQRNLLNLTFNLETVTQSRAVARLNALAVFFLPISFVATIFGITTMEAPAYWYPVAAVPTLILTAGIAIVLSRSTEHNQDASRSSMLPKALLPLRPKWFAPKPRLTRDRRDSGSSFSTASGPPPQNRFTGSPGLEPTLRAIPVRPPIIVTDAGGQDQATEQESSSQLTDDELERRPTTSNMHLGYRVTGVARVSTNLLSPDPYANAATGALRSPSGSLRHE